jgi:hypothetical protein
MLFSAEVETLLDTSMGPLIVLKIKFKGTWLIRRHIRFFANIKQVLSTYNFPLTFGPYFFINEHSIFLRSFICPVNMCMYTCNIHSHIHKRFLTHEIQEITITSPGKKFPMPR